MLFNKSTNKQIPDFQMIESYIVMKMSKNILGATAEMAPRIKPDKRKHAFCFHLQKDKYSVEQNHGVSIAKHTGNGRSVCVHNQDTGYLWEEMRGGIGGSRMVQYSKP